MTWHCLLKTECAEACVANGASRLGVRQLLAAFRLLELERPVECASTDALSAKTVPRHFPVSPISPKRQVRSSWKVKPSLRFFSWRQSSPPGIFVLKNPGGKND
jgi:hypothetical protein